ncbi:hypothetical protein UFOVP187_19 [uncultured Caudovirales phage]|uniref:Uncharacterized protein n=1 Tax=uncultured Caudovirales phage TaxID=2100421 RepID=A0A6J7WEQ4_9CAUD|nr:hypothetical protein UFOVP187_19 [uncultured Caudovirales phage]
MKEPIIINDPFNQGTDFRIEDNSDCIPNTITLYMYDDIIDIDDLDSMGPNDMWNMMVMSNDDAIKLANTIIEYVSNNKLANFKFLKK